MFAVEQDVVLGHGNVELCVFGVKMQAGQEVVVKRYLSWDMRRFTALKQSLRQIVASSIS